MSHTLKLQFESVDDMVLAYSAELSQGQATVSTELPLEIGTAVKVEVVLPVGGTALTLDATVATATEGDGVWSLGLALDPACEALQELERQILTEDAGSEDAEGTQPLTIVIIDDDQVQREATSAVFLARGDNVHLAKDGLDGLAACLREKPDVVLSDVEMPRMDGWQLLRMLRARPMFEKVPILFLTALASDRDRLLGYRVGVDDYIGKPHRPLDLLARVDSAVQRARRGDDAGKGKDGLRGDLQMVSLTSILSFLELERGTGILRMGPKPVAVIILDSGRIGGVSVEGAASSDPQQLMYELLGVNEGSFEYVPGPVDAGDVQLPIGPLLLEHARQSDEGAR